MEEGALIQKIKSKEFRGGERGVQLHDKLYSRSLETTFRLERMNLGRIKFSLFELAKKHGKSFGDEKLLKFNLTAGEPGMMTDFSRQKVTKTRSTLKKKGVITYSRN